jgi:hypothetical protein
MAFVANSGTLILLANEERGIVVGSDSRSSGGRAKDDEVKVVEMGPWTLAAVRGKAALYDPDDPNRSFLVVDRLKGYLKDRRLPFPSDLPPAEALRAIASAFEDAIKEIEAAWNAAALEDKPGKGVRESLGQPGFFGINVAQIQEDDKRLIADVCWGVSWSSSEEKVAFSFLGGDDSWALTNASVGYSWRSDEKFSRKWDQKETAVRWMQQEVHRATKEDGPVGGPLQVRRVTQNGIEQYPT